MDEGGESLGMAAASLPRPAGRSRPNESEKISVQHFSIDGQHAMREARIGLECAVLEKLDRLKCAVRNRNDLIVFTVQDEGRYGDRLQVLRLVSFGESFDAVIVGFGSRLPGPWRHRG